MELLLRVGSTARRLHGTASALQEASSRCREAKRQLQVLVLQVCSEQVSCNHDWTCHFHPSLPMPS